MFSSEIFTQNKTQKMFYILIINLFGFPFFRQKRSAKIQLILIISNAVPAIFKQNSFFRN